MDVLDLLLNTSCFDRNCPSFRSITYPREIITCAGSHKLFSGCAIKPAFSMSDCILLLTLLASDKDSPAPQPSSINVIHLILLSWHCYGLLCIKTWGWLLKGSAYPSAMTFRMNVEGHIPSQKLMHFLNLPGMHTTMPALLETAEYSSANSFKAQAAVSQSPYHSPSVISLCWCSHIWPWAKRIMWPLSPHLKQTAPSVAILGPSATVDCWLLHCCCCTSFPNAVDPTNRCF